MDKSTWVSPEDRELQRAQAMRQRFADRKPVILDPRRRKIGIDVQALQQQAEERRQREAREKAREDAFDHMTLDHMRLVIEADESERRVRRRIAEDDDRFRMRDQTPSQCREYDIWRPDLLKISQPARLGDEDDRLGISAGQIFQGEDLKISERLAAQAAQRDEWRREQLRERGAIQRAQKMEDLRNDLVELETQKRLAELDRATEAARARIHSQLAYDNRRLRDEKHDREEEDLQRDQDMNEAELRANARSRTIDEKMQPRGGHPMEYRGMTIDEQKSVIDAQARQMIENDKRRESDQERERQWGEYEAYLRAKGDLSEAEWRRRAAQEQQELYHTHLAQEREFKDRQRYLNKDLYGTNVPDDSYYEQWGNSVR